MDHNRHSNGSYGGLGHNREPRTTVQWQTPHRGRDTTDATEAPVAERDLDKVESAFIEGFGVAADPTSFLRLSGIAFELIPAKGIKLRLLRVEIDAITDVGSVTPHLGGTSFRYDPLPGTLASRRRRLRFVYFDGSSLHALTFAEARSRPVSSGS